MSTSVAVDLLLSVVINIGVVCVLLPDQELGDAACEGQAPQGQRAVRVRGAAAWQT